MPTYASTILADSPVAYWRLGETAGATTAADATGNGNAGTYVGSPTLGVTSGLTGDADTAVTFNGTSQSVTVGGLGSLGSNLASGLTFETILKSTTTLRRTIVALAGTGAQRFEVITNQNSASASSAGSLFARVGDASGKALSVAVDANAGWNDGNYHHLAITLDPPNNAGAIYLDGVAQAVAYGLQQTPASFADFTSGVLAQNGSGGAFYPGTLDEAAVYNRVLSASAALRHRTAMLGRFGLPHVYAALLQQQFNRGGI